MALMNNATAIAELSRQLTRIRTHETLRLFFTGTQVLLIIIGTPLFLYNRHHPMVKYRSWTLNLACCVFATIWTMCDAFLALENGVKYENRPIVFWIRTLSVIASASCYMPIYLRHYFLLQLPIVQTKLLNSETMLDPEKYKALSKSLQLLKYLSTELSAWVYFSINFFPFMIVGIVYLLEADFDRMSLLLPVRASFYSSNFTLISTTFSLVFLLWYGPRSPKENFHIMTQFYIAAAMTLANTAIAVIGSSGLKGVKIEWCVISNITLTFLCILVNLAFPLQFYIRNMHHQKDLHHSQSVHPKKQARLTPKEHISGDSGNSVSDQSGSDCEIHSSDITVHSKKLNPVADIQKCPKNSNYTLPRIMADPTLYIAFCKYLACEFSMESLLFIETIKRFQDQIREYPTSATLKLLSDAIHKEFIASNSINEVNLTKQIIVRVTTTLADVMSAPEFNVDKAICIYDEAAAHIEHILVVNHLRRFRASTLFREATSQK
ncbi:hypothetical protein BASA61_000810 [Batrachochytrium salamandrivorans]|nr:hypothetical protein BASA60_008336 [Batrachochytrium salamandrivorans]KAH6602721.1 hypothetical protein BASA61_000810 [Batrachochytrium salamandrivorans]